MEVFKLFDNKKYFKIDFKENLDESDIPYIKSLVEKSFDMNKTVTLCKPIISKNEIDIDCEHSKTYAKISLNTKNQKGLMAYMMSIFDQLSIRVATAKVQTIKNRTRNLFLIEKKIDLCKDNGEEILNFFIQR
jgi:[protein-PII] uridylyltransferase